MHETAGILGWLEGSTFAQAMRGWLWLYPIVEIVHILGFVILVGAVVMFDLRVLGLSKRMSVRALGQHVLPWVISALLLIVPAGLMMFSAHPGDFITNPVFQLKMILIAFAGINAALFHMQSYKTVDRWDQNVAAPGIAKLHAVISLTVWIGVISCGRLLAYT